MEPPKSPKMGLRMMKSLQCLRVPNDEFSPFGHCHLFAFVPPKRLFFAAAAERREMRRKEGKLLEAAREGDISALSSMV